MRFLFASAVVGLAALAGVPTALSDQEFTICYPSPCGTYTADFSGSGAGKAIDEKTPWYGEIGLNKFNNHSGARTLTSVTLKTMLYFNSTVWATRNSGTTNGTLRAGVMLHMDIAGSNAGKLGQYWGRFGNYDELYDNTVTEDPLTHLELYTNQGQNGQDVSGYSPAQYSSAPTLFQPYTYPLFDIVGAPVPALNKVSYPEGGYSWAYYIPSTASGTLGWPQFWYGQVGGGQYVTRLTDDLQPLYDPSQTVECMDPEALGSTFDANTCKGWKSQYFQQDPHPELTHEDKYYFNNSDSAFPVGVEQQLGTSVFNRFDRANPDTVTFAKSIRLTDRPGGFNRDITPQQMFQLFQGVNQQVMFDAAATGQVVSQFDGGNADFRQQTYAKVAMSVEYTYTLCSTCQDPQFGGFQGQTYQVHGFPGSYFHMFSAPKFQMNGRFTYLATGHCKYSHTPCWTHPGTYVDDITFVVDELLVRITAGPVGSGYTVLVNEEPFKSNSNSSDFTPTKFYDRNTGLTVHLLSPLKVVVKTELVSFTIHNADHFFNIDSQLLARAVLVAGRKPSASYPHPQTGAPWFPEYPIHGFIGQTWANKQYPHNKLYAGEIDDYVEARPYGTDSLFSQYANNQDKPQWESLNHH